MDGIAVERDGGIVTATITAPETKNALTSEMFDTFRAICGEVNESPDDRVLVVTGAGDAFCSGANLKDAGGGFGGGGYIGARARMQRIHAGALALHNCAKPTIAAVNGVAAGAGANLALGCDIVFASQSARFTQVFIKRGLVVDYGGSWLLPRLVGPHRAKELAFTGDMVGAEEAERIGLVNRVVQDADLMAEVNAFAHRLASGPPIQLALIKQNINAGMSASMEDVLQMESQTQAAALGTEDTIEAVAAWLQKRDPVFKGR